MNKKQAKTIAANKQLEKKFHLWFSWQHEKEERRLNEQSGQGLHWTRAGLFRDSFERDPSVRYTYRLDYQSNLGKGEKFAEYVQLYRDAGWEHAGSFGTMWHYFRRPWRQEEEPLLYTDRDSLIALYKRLRRVMAAMLALNFVIMSLNGISLLSRIDNHLWSIVVPVLGIYAALFILLGVGIGNMSRKIKAIAP